METPNQSETRWLVTGSILAALGVGLGAFGAHGLEDFLSGRVADVAKSVEYWSTATRYLMYHSIAVLIVGLTSLLFARSLAFSVAAGLFVSGIVLFSGCLYAIALTEIKVLGAVVPIGGLMLIAGWLTFAGSLLFKRN